MLGMSIYTDTSYVNFCHGAKDSCNLKFVIENMGLIKIYLHEDHLKQAMYQDYS